MSNFGAIDDSESVTHDQVEGIVRALCVSYSHVRRSFFKKHTVILSALNDGDVTEVVLLVAECYDLPKGYLKRIGYSAKMPDPAMMETERELFTGKHLGGTLYFQQSKVDLCKMPRYRLLHIIAHELTHARMAIDAHKLKRSEFAVDVTALLVAGNSKGYNESMTSPFVQYGYIRRELLDEIYRCLAKYSPVIYLR